jgi:Domain of unknown function (DUF6602)
LVHSHIRERLEGIRQMLMGAHYAGNRLSNASKGNEREAFINGFLSQALPPHFRFGSGDATDQRGARSGQLDIVVEYPFVPSLPIVAGRTPRLYLAEGIVAVIEVKSNIKSQWKEVESTAGQLASLVRNYDYPRGVTLGPRALAKIPLFAIGYTGWKTFETIRAHVNPQNDINGVLVIDKGHFFGEYKFGNDQNIPQQFECKAKDTSMALWELITCIHHAGSMVTSATKNVPIRYDQL